jgi:hypothetical protein
VKSSRIVYRPGSSFPHFSLVPAQLTEKNKKYGFAGVASGFFLFLL